MSEAPNEESVSLWYLIFTGLVLWHDNRLFALAQMEGASYDFSRRKVRGIRQWRRKQTRIHRHT